MTLNTYINKTKLMEGYKLKLHITNLTIEVVFREITIIQKFYRVTYEKK